jgi:AraC-like DNA-binding protein
MKSSISFTAAQDSAGRPNGSSPVAFSWVQSSILKFSPQGKFSLSFPPECPLQFHCLEFSLEHRLTPSCHDFLELVYVFEGQGRFLVEDRAFPMKTGDVLLVGCQQFHRIQADRRQRLRIIALHFLPELIHRPGGPVLDFEYLKPFHYRGAAFSHRIAAASPSSNLVLDRLQQIDREIRSTKRDYALAVKTYLLDILLVVSRHYQQESSPRVLPDRHLRDFDRLREVFGHVNHHFKEPLAHRDVAKLAGMSPTYFCRFFKTITGNTFTDYVLKLRLDFAIELLSGSAMTMTEIAYASGFSSHSYFDRVFKRLMGMTPLEFRHKLDA